MILQEFTATLSNNSVASTDLKENLDWKFIEKLERNGYYKQMLNGCVLE